MMREWQKAPEFRALNDKEQEINSQIYLGQYQIIYFYPKAFTPGCTKESNEFNEKMDSLCRLEFSGEEIAEGDLQQALEIGAAVIGISPDTPQRLAQFRERYSLQMELISDPDKKIAAAFGALKEDGKSILRSTFILDRWGRIRKAWYGVKVNGHVETVLAALKDIVKADLSLNPQITYRKARRALSPKPIPREELKQLIRAGHLAPSCFNKQPWQFTVVDDRQILNQLHEGLSGGNYWMKTAPALIAVHTKKEADCVIGEREYYLFDTGLAVGLLLIQATQMGIIAHPAAGFKPEIFKEVLNIPRENQIIAVIAVGYEGDITTLNEDHQKREKAARERKSLNEVLTWNGY